MNSFASLGSFARKARFLLAGTLGLGLLGASASLVAAQQTTSQTTSNQLNQLFEAETTNNKSAAGEGYVNGGFTFVQFPGDVNQYRYQLQGQYSFTDQLAVGGFIPLVDSKVGDSSFGFGDVTFYGQYKLDQLVNHDVVDLTAQLDMVLPTGSISRFRDTGRFGIRPSVLAYKDFGQFGPGDLGAYASAGFTITTHSDFRMDLAATYEWQKIVGVLEFFDQAGDKMGEPMVNIIPGAAYRGLGPIELALGFPFGLNDGSPDWGIIFKATYAFQK
jgi:hypothetical protein